MADILESDPIRTLAEPIVLANPYPALAQLREKKPMFWYEPLESWIVTRYDDCVTVLRNTDRFAADWRRIGEEVPPHAISIQTVDPPDHTAIRRLLMTAIK